MRTLTITTIGLTLALGAIACDDGAASPEAGTDIANHTEESPTGPRLIGQCEHTKSRYDAELDDYVVTELATERFSVRAIVAPSADDEDELQLRLDDFERYVSPEQTGFYNREYFVMTITAPLETNEPAFARGGHQVFPNDPACNLTDAPQELGCWATNGRVSVEGFVYVDNDGPSTFEVELGHIELEIEADGMFSPVDGLERSSNCTIEGILPAEELEKIPTAYDWNQ